MKRLIIVLIAIAVMLGIMFAEYRYIMLNLHPYKGDNGTVYIEIFGQVDEYYAEPVSEID